MNELIGRIELFDSVSIRGKIENDSVQLKGKINSQVQVLKGRVSYFLAEHYCECCEITPDSSEHILNTKNKLMDDNVTVHEIPYGEVSNPYGGYTVTIA